MDKEDIHFKTLSQGLGFYSKTPSLRKTVEKNPAFKTAQKKTLPSVPDILLSKSLGLNNGQTYEQLRKALSQDWLEETPAPPTPAAAPAAPAAAATPPAPAPATATPAAPPTSAPAPATAAAPPASTAAPSHKKTSPLFPPQKTEESFQQSSLQSTLKPLEKPLSFSLKSLMADSLLSMVLFFCPLILFSALTQARPFYTLFVLWPVVTGGFFVFCHIYSLLCRLFCFDTYGDTLSHRRLCAKNNQTLPPHPMLLFVRSLLSCLTLGTLPLFSLLFKKDFLSLVSRLDFKDTSHQDKQYF